MTRLLPLLTLTIVPWLMPGDLPGTAAQPQQAQTQPAQQPPPPSPSSQQPTFRSGIDVVSLNVTVTDGGKAFVTDLNRGDFQVYEDGVLQDLTYFTRTATPISLSLLVDTSASMEDKLSTAQAAAIGFVKRLRPEDQAQVVDFDNRVTILQNFTTDQAALEGAIRKTTANGSTSLYNAIYIALKELKKVRATSTEDLHRQAIVVLSDGEDTSSLVPFEEVLELAKRSEVAIYTIALRQKENVGRGFNEADFVLKQFASETGGRSFYPQTPAELAAIYGQINEELESQYLLAYSSRNVKRDGKWRRIVVRTTRASAVPRTKQGYYGPQ
jgi:Ca-activated chloride channel family protein